MKDNGTDRIYHDPVLLIHGLWGTRHVWDSWLPEFLDRRTYTMDLRGHGDRHETLDGVSLENYREDVVAELRELRQPTVLIGHSAGGAIALMAAARVPHLVRHVVLLASDPPRSSGGRLPMKLEMLRPGILGALLTGKAFSLKPREQNLVRGGVKTEVELVAESGRALKQIVYTLHDVPKLHCPVTVIGAENDQFVPFPVQEKIAEYFGTQAIKFPGNHFFHIDPRYQSSIISRIKREIEVRAGSRVLVA